jgi:phospholipid/cholesterol/gamma-HCH transport system permease protein
MLGTSFAHHALFMPDSQPRLFRDSLPAGKGWRLSGHWTAAQLAEPATWPLIELALKACAAQAHTSPWDLRDLSRLDHTGAQALWNAWGHQWPVQLQMLDAHRPLLERVARFSSPAPTVQHLSAWAAFLSLGALVWLLIDHLKGLVRLTGQLLLDSLQLLRAPSRGPWRDFSGHLFRIGATALPITALVGFLIGVVLAYLISKQLSQFGANAFIVNILGISLIRELGPVLAAILIAGRSGSAITAQIGVMRVTEELDAMRVMGIPRR